MTPVQLKPTGKPLAVPGPLLSEKTAARPAKDQPSAAMDYPPQPDAVSAKLADLDQVLKGLRELKTRKGDPNAQKVHVVLGKQSPLIPSSGETASGTHQLDNLLRFYGIVPSNPRTPAEVQAAIDAVENTRSEISLGLDDNTAQVDALLHERNEGAIAEVVSAQETTRKKPLLSYLTEGIPAHALEKAKATPAALLALILKSPNAEQLLQTLLKKLGGAEYPLNQVISPAVKVRLVMKAIALSLDPLPARHDGHVAGFDLTSREHWGQSYASITASFQQHLVGAKKLSPLEAQLASYILKPDFPAEFAVADIPEALPYQGSAVWVNFKHGVALAEMIEPGSARRMSFQELVDLPGRLSEQATTDEQRSVIAATRIPAVLEWATVQGVIPQKDAYSQDEIHKAVSVFDEHVSDIVEATTQLAVDVPLRKHYFERMEKGTSRTEVLSLINPFFALYRHLNGEKLAPSDVSYEYPVYDEDRFKTEFERYLTQAKAGYARVVSSHLSQLPLKDRVAIEQGEVTLYALRVKPDSDKETEDDKKAAVTRPGFIIKAEHEGQTHYYEMNPVKGIARRRDDLKPVLESYDPAEKSYTKDFISIDHSTDGVPSESIVVRNSRAGRAAFKQEWNDFKAGKGPRPKSFSVVVPQQLAHFPAPANPSKTPVPKTLTSNRSEEIAVAISRGLFYVDEDHLQEWAASDPARESAAQKNDEAFWERIKGVGQFFIPFWGGIEDLVNGRTKEGILSLMVDGLLTFAGPAGRLASGSVRLLSGAGRISLRGLLPKFAPLVKEFGVSVGRNLNPLDPVLPGIGFKGTKSLKFNAASIARIKAGAAQFKQSLPFKLPGKGRYEITSGLPLTARTLPEGGVVRVPEGISSDQVRVLKRQTHTDVVVGDDVFRFDPRNPDKMIKLGGAEHTGPLDGFALTCGAPGKRSKRDLTDLCYTKHIEPGGTPVFQDAQALEHRRLIPLAGQSSGPRTVVHEHRLYRVNEAGSQELLPIATRQPITYKRQTSGELVNEPDFGFDDFGQPRALNRDTVVVKLDAISDLSHDQRVVRGFKVDHGGRQYVVVEGDTGVHYYAELTGSGPLDFHRLTRNDPVDLDFIRQHDQYKDLHGHVAQGTPNNQLVVLPSIETLINKILAENPMSPAEIDHLIKVLSGLPVEKRREVLMSVYASGSNPGKVVVAAKPIRLEPIKKPADFAQLTPEQQNGVYAQGGKKTVDDQFDATGIRSANQQVPGLPGEHLRNQSASETVGWLYTRTNAPNYSEIVLKTGAGNCDQMAKVAVDTINVSGGHARIAQVPGHTFAVVGGPPGHPRSRGFAGPEWADAWVVDPWAGITCPARDYPARFKQRMQEWSQSGRRILVSDGKTPAQSVWSDPMTPSWIDATVNGEAQVF
ncbi:hypothetical protein ACW9IB_19815 [Pseudomonas sp. SDO524_S393]